MKQRIETYDVDGKLVDTQEVEIPDVPDASVDQAAALADDFGKGTSVQRIARIEQAVQALVDGQS